MIMIIIIIIAAVVVVMVLVQVDSSRLRQTTNGCGHLAILSRNPSLGGNYVKGLE